LIVDDEPGICRLLETLFLEEGHDVLSAQKPLAALDLLRREKFDVVITDIRMPKVNGLQILEAVRQLSPRTAVILMTAHSSVESAIQAVKLGASDYILKPFRNDQIKLAVYRLLDRERAAQTPAAEQLSTAEDPSLSTYREAKQRVVSGFEQDYLRRLLLRAGGNISQAAAWADMDRKNFYELLKKNDLYTPSE